MSILSSLNLTVVSRSMRHPEKIAVHLFDTRSDFKLERSLLAVHFPAVQLLSIYTLARIPAEDTLRVYPAVHIPALSAASISAFRGPILDLLIVKPDNSLAVLTHGVRMVDVSLSPHEIPASKSARRRAGVSMSSPKSSHAEDAMSVDESMPAGAGDDSDASMHSIIDKNKIVGISEPLHGAATIHFEDGNTTRTRFACIPRDQLTSHCFWALSYALTGPRAFALHCSWLAKWSTIGASDADEDEWTCFVTALCELVDIPSPYTFEVAAETNQDPWDALAYSASHQRLENDLVFRLLNAPFSARRTPVKPSTAKPHEDVVPCLLALHTLGESYKLKTDAAYGFLPRLARLLIALGRAARPEWADHWVRLFPDVLEGWADPKRQGNCLSTGGTASLHFTCTDTYADPRLRPQPPDIYGYLFSRLVEPTAKPSWTALGHISHLFHFEPAMQHGRMDPVKDLYKLFGVWECFADATVPTARKRAENAMQVMVRLGVTIDDLARMPYGIAQPIREALRTCQSVPSGDWPVQAYHLALRADLAQMVTGDSTHVASRDSFRQVNKHLVSSRNMPTTVFSLHACFAGFVGVEDGCWRAAGRGACRHVSRACRTFRSRP